MKSRLESDESKSSQVETLATNDWPLLQVLRRNLQAMKEPVPASIKQLFSVEKKFSIFEVAPSAITAKAIDDSDTLQHYLETLPFSEEELMRDAEMRTRRSTRAAGTPAETGSRSFDSHESSTARAADKSQLKSVESAFALNNPAVVPAAEETRSDTPHVENDDSFTPEFMRDWIDEILFTDAQDNNSPRENDQSVERQDNQKSTKTRLKGSIRGSTARHEQYSSNEMIPNNSSRSKLAADFKSGKNSKSSANASEKSSDPSSVSRENQPTSPRSSRNKRPGLPLTAASENSESQQLAGIALLENLVQLEKSTVISKTKHQPVPNITETQKSTGNSAWQKHGKSVVPIAPPGKNFPENNNISTPFASANNPRNSVHQDESERISTLVNEALIEQATRSGVDLS